MKRILRWIAVLSAMLAATILLSLTEARPGLLGMTVVAVVAIGGAWAEGRLGSGADLADPRLQVRMAVVYGSAVVLGLALVWAEIGPLWIAGSVLTLVISGQWWIARRA